jgi:hypothetical protein
MANPNAASTSVIDARCVNRGVIVRVTGGVTGVTAVVTDVSVTDAVAVWLRFLARWRRWRSAAVGSRGRRVGTTEATEGIVSVWIEERTASPRRPLVVSVVSVVVHPRSSKLSPMGPTAGLLCFR